MSNLKLKITLILSFFVLNSCQKKTETEDLNDFIYLESTIESLINGYKNGDIKAVELIKKYIDRIRKIDMAGPNLRSIIQINPDAVKIATELDNLIRFETDKQLNQFSIIYFNKLKLNSKISHE